MINFFKSYRIPCCIVIVCLLNCGALFAQAPVITSFSPDTVCQGDAVIITGSNFTNVKSVKLGTDTALKYTVTSATSITAYVSVKAATGFIIVTTNGGADTTAEKLTINPLPVPGLDDINNPGAPFTYCNGSTTTYTLVVGNSTTQAGSGASYDIDWGDGSTHFTQTGWAVNAQTSHTYNNQGYFKIKLTVATGSGCSKTETYNFYNGTNPLASITTTASTVNLCAPADVTFVIGNWSNNSPGTTYLLDFGDGTTPVTLQHPLNGSNSPQQVTHTYQTSSCPKIDYTAILQPTNACYTTTYTVNQIIIRDKPIADFTIDTPVCVTDAVCFTNKTTAGSSGNNCSTLSTYLWDFGDGTTATTTTPPCHTYASAGTYTVKLTSSNTTCGSDTKTKTVVVKATSTSPTVSATPVSYCQGDVAVPLTATGTGLLWYTSATGGTGTSVAPTPSTAVAVTTTYYVSQTLAGKCESPRVAVTVVVHAIPNEPGVTTPVDLCKDQATVPLTATGTGLLWYKTATGGTGSSTAPTPSTTATGSFNFYVSQTTNNCESERAVITVNVETLPGAPVVVSPIIYCQNQPAVPLTASGSGLRWYTTATGGTGSTVAPTPSTITVGSTDYYVSQSTNCGEGPRALITVTVKAAPSATISYPVTNLCNVNNTAQTPNPPVNVTLTGSTGGTYSISPSTGLPINAAGAIDPSGATAGTYTIYYKIVGTGGCSDFITSTTVNVNSTPNASITYPAICTSNGDIKVQLTGSQGGSFTSTTGLTINAATGTITASTSTAGNYVVTYTIAASSPCPGFTTTTNVTVTKAPTAAITYNVSNLCNVTNTATTPNPPLDVILTGNTGGTYSIQPATGLPINAINGRIDPSGATAGTYTISYTITGSGGCSDFITSTTITVNGTPEATISYPPICTSNNAVSVQLTGTQGGSFSSRTGLTINAATGAITASTSTAGNYVVTYTIQPSAPCPGFTTTTNVTVTKAPSATISYGVANLCNVINSANTPNPKVAITLTGNTGGTYAISPLTGLPINTVTGTIDPSGAVAGTYTISYTIAAAGGCAVFVTTTQITINSTPVASIKYSALSYCRGTTTPQAVTFSGTTGGTYSSTQGLSVNATTGEINPSLSLPGTYTVTYTIQPSAPCPGFITTTTVTIDDSPVITFSSLTQSICSGGTAVFKPSSTVANTVYAWAVVGALPVGVTGITSGTTSDPNASISLSFTNTGTITQSITVHVIPTNPSQNPCDGAPIDLTLTVNPIPAALVTDTFKYCMHTPPEALTVNAAPGNTVNWYDANMNALNAAPIINTNVPATFIYYASQSNTYGCESPKTKVVAVVNATAKIVSSSYTNPTSCGIPSGSIVLNVLDLNNNPMPDISFIVHYTKFQTAYTIIESSDANGKITIPLVAGTYSNIYVESNGCLSQKIPDIFVLKDPDPPAQPIAGYNGPLCSENILSLSASSPTSSEIYPIDYVWVGPAFGALADTSRNTVILFPSASVSYSGTYIVYAIQNNCISPATSFTVAIKQSPTKPQVTTRSPLCVGDNLTLQATSSIPGNSVLSYVWNGPGRGFPVNNAYAAINNVQVQDGGEYSITVSSAQTGCSSTTDTLIKIGNYPIVKFAQDTLTLPTGYLLNLATTITNANEPNVLPMKSYAWTPSQDINCNDAICSAPVATIKNAGCFYLTATNVYGCVGRDTICVKVFCQSSQVFLPNAFTPNGNAENAVFMVRASGIASVKSFRIFNRWGRLVFERSNFAPNSPSYGWNGLINGKPADVGVYVYTVDVVCENGLPYTYKGNVTLLR